MDNSFVDNYLSATDARQAIESGTLNGESLVRQCLSRVTSRDPLICAWKLIEHDQAIATAIKLDKSSNKGLLHGIPIGVKDIIDVAGMPTENGTAIYSNAPKANRDAASVAIARMAGAVILGKTTTTELAGFTPSGTRNPHHTEHTPGGSSSGSAATVADGHVPIAIGTQTAGSIIRPASFCGVFGFKPTFGLVPREGVKMQSNTLDTVGVFARTADDLALWYAAMTGAKYAPARIKIDNAADQNNTSGLRINIINHLLDRTDIEMGVALAEASDILATAGVKIREIKLPAAFNHVEALQRTIQLYEMAKWYAPEMSMHHDKLSPQLLATLQEGASISADEYQRALSQSMALRKEADNLCSECDAWLMPSAIGAAPQGLASTGDPLFNRLASALHQPAVNVPHYKTKAGLPLGLQLIGGRHQDEKLLSVAKQVQNILKLHRGVA